MQLYGGSSSVSSSDAKIDPLSAFSFPLKPIKLKNGMEVQLDKFADGDRDLGHALLNQIIDEGLAWPFEERLSQEEFVNYFLSHAAFVVRIAGGSLSPEFASDLASPWATCEKGNVVGMFYIKPNFPGRCSHICNGGFITVSAFRGVGIGRIMAQQYLRFAPILGYKGSLFNLVFKTNLPSIKLWQSLGFTQTGLIPKAGRLKGHEELIDAMQFHYDFTKKEVDQ